MRVNALEARDFAIDSLTKRLRSSGLSDKVVDEIDVHMRSLYAAGWARYEENHGVEHPVRYWERVTANA
jgi:hypothetical protein